MTMSIRTPSKVILAKGFPGMPYHVKYVIHGSSIKYSNIEKTLNSKGMWTPEGYDAVDYLGFIDISLLMGEMYSGSESRLLNSLPEQLVEAMKLDIERLWETGKISSDEGLTLSLFIYKYKKVR